MQVVVRPHLLSHREQDFKEFRYGMTVAEVANCLDEIDPRVRQFNLVALVNGETLPRDQWETRRLVHTDQRLEFAVALQGGGGRTKQILGVIAMISLSFVVGPLAGMIPGLTSTGVMLAKAGIMLVGSLLVNAIFAPPRPNNGQGEVSPTYSFSGQSNQPRRFARLPRIYGRHRYVGDVAAMPYTVNIGDDSYLYAVYSFGYGPLRFEDFRIGQNPLTNYSDWELKAHESFTSSDQLELYKSDVWQDSFSFELLQATPVVVATQDNTERAIVDISFPQGFLATNDDGGWEFIESDIDFEYRELGTTAWAPIEINSISRGQFQTKFLKFYLGAQFMPGIAVPHGPDESAVTTGFPAGTRTFIGWAPEGAEPAVGTTISVGPYPLVVESIVPRADNNLEYDARNNLPRTVTTTTGLPGDLPLGGDAVFTYSLTVGGPGTGSSRLHIREKQQSAFSISASLSFPAAGQYEIRLSKIEADYPDDDKNHLWRRYVTAVRSLKSQPPIKPEVEMAVVELKIKATGQLNGTIDQFSAVCTSRLRHWTGTGWAVDETRNPAWVYLDILQGSANNRPLPDHRIDFDALFAWAARCDRIDAPFVGPMGTCDVVVDRQFTVWELLQSVATTGRAAPTMRDNKYTVLVDSDDRQPVQMFTPRNSRNLRSARTYVDEPHALRVKWIDSQNNFEAAETIVYNTGHDAVSATVFEDINSFGMVRAEQALRWGRYMLAQGKLRQERFSIDVDIEHIVCLRGDLVLVAHDVIEVGGDASRIVEIQGGRVFVDSPPTLDVITDFTAYGVRVRNGAGYIGPVLDINGIGHDGEFDWIDLSLIPTDMAAGDLLVLGPKSQVVGEYVVDYIRPTTDLAATIGLEEYAPAVFQAEYTGVENLVYVPQGGGMLAPPVNTLQVTATITYVNSVPMATVRASWRPAQGLPYQPDDYRVWLITPTGNEQFLGTTNALFWELDPVDLTTLNGYSFVFRVRPFYGSRGIGPAAEASIVVEYVPRQAPPLVDNFDVQNGPNGVRRYLWSFNGPIPPHVVGIQVRFLAGNVADPQWNNAEELILGDYLVQNGAEFSVPIGAGTFTFLARTIDDKGFLSDDAFVLVRDLSAQEAIDFTPPPTPTGFNAFGGFGIVAFVVDEPQYTVGNGHGYTQVYAAIVPTGGPEPAFAEATPFTSFRGVSATAGAASATSYRFWAKWVSNANVESLDPAGPVVADTAINVAATIEALEGQIGEDQLTDTLGARIELIDANSGGYDSLKTWYFDTTVEAWTAITGTLQWVAGWVEITATGALPRFISPAGLAYPGATYPIIRARIRRLAGSGWSGSLNYTTIAGPAVHGFSSSYYERAIEPLGGMAVGETAVAEWDMNLLNVGGTDYIDSTVDRIQLILGATAEDKFSVDWVAIGRNAPGASAASITTESNARVAGDQANATSVMNLTTTVNGNTTTIQQQASSINGLSGQYTVKIDSNNYVTGFGLASTPVNGTPFSTFAVRADSFFVSNPAGPSVAPAVPFIVRTTSTVLNGQTVPVGVYMRDTFIQNGAISSAKIGLAVITDAHIGSLNADKITAGSLAANFIDSKNLTIQDGAGRVILGAGTELGGTDLAVGVGANMIRNADFRSQFTGWAVSYTGGMTVGTITTNLAGWFMPGEGSAGLQQNGSQAGEMACYSEQINVRSDKRYEYSVYSGAHRCMVDMLILWKNASDVTISVSGSTTNNMEQQGGVILENYKRIYGFATPPAGAYYARVYLRKNATLAGTGVDSWGFFARPFFGEANAGQSLPSAWNPGNFGGVTVANASTYIEAAAIKTAHIGALQVNTLQIADNAVTVPLGASNNSQVNFANGQLTTVLETGYGSYPAGARIAVNALISYSSGNMTARVYLVSSTGAEIAADMQLGATTGSAFPARDTGPLGWMFTVPTTGSWKAQIRMQAFDTSTYYFGGTIIAMGVKK